MSTIRYAVVEEDVYGGKVCRLIRCVPSTDLLPQAKECADLLGHVIVDEVDEAGQVVMQVRSGLRGDPDRPKQHGVHHLLIHDTPEDACKASANIVRAHMDKWDEVRLSAWKRWNVHNALLNRAEKGAVETPTKEKLDADFKRNMPMPTFDPVNPP